MKKLLRIFFLVACIAAVLAYFYMDQLLQFFSPKPHTSIEVAFQKTKEIDKLYTGVYLIPVLDPQYGTLKRNKWKFWADDEEVVKGFCKKKYEVSVGYDNLTALLSDEEVKKNACNGKTDKLPEPKILAVNTQNTIATGNYDGDGRCYQWDQNAEERKDIIRTEMHNIGILEKVNNRGRESLKALASVFCE